MVLAMNSSLVPKFALLLYGASGYFLWISSWKLFNISFFLFVSSILLLLISLFCRAPKIITLTKHQKLMFLLFMIVLCIHAVGIFLPETGFDALWYHLPITEVYSHTNSVFYIPELYQSAMPRLGSMLFSFLYQFWGVSGAKLVAYMNTIFFFVMFCDFCRKNLSRTYSLLALTSIAMFHVVSWQASSAYVDLLRASFEIAAISFSMQKGRSTALFSGLMFGLALSTKLVAVFFVPVYVLSLLFHRPMKEVFITFTGLLIVILPWYFQSYAWTGNPVFPLFETLNGQEQLLGEGVSSWVSWVVKQLPFFIISPIASTVHKESYTTTSLVLFYQFLLLYWKKLWDKFSGLVVYAVGFLFLWSMIPPVSVRYALSGFAVLLFLSFYCFQHIVVSNIVRSFFIILVLSSIGVSLIVRLGSVAAALPYLTGHETKEEYVSRFSVGIAKGPINAWYSGYWHQYQQ